VRCYCCNNILKPSEATAKFKESGAFTEMCERCINTLDDVEVIEGAGVDDDEYSEDEE
jgi:hypothetical protein